MHKDVHIEMEYYFIIVLFPLNRVRIFVFQILYRSREATSRFKYVSVYEVGCFARFV